MSSIPLPALAIRPPESPLQTYTTLAGLLGAQQQRQLGSQEIQRGQIQLNDQQAMSTAMRQWDGKDPDELPGLVLKNGGSANAVFGLKSQILDYKTKASTLTKDQLANQSTVNDLIAGHLESVKSAPDEQKQDAYNAAVNDLQQKGYIQQGQFPAQYPGDDKIALFEKQFMGQKAIVDQAMKQQQTATSAAQAGEATARAGEAQESTQKTAYELGLEKQVGGLTGPIADAQYRSLVAKQQMGQSLTQQEQAQKVAYEKQKTLVPQFNINMASQLSGPALDQMATQFAQTGTLPAVGFGAAGTAMRTKIANRAADLFPDQSLALAKAAFGSNEGALKHLQTQFSTVDAFENTAIKNLDQLTEAGKAIPDLGTRFANTPVRAINEKVLGTPEMARFRAALATAQNETAKVLNSANATGVLSDSARGELQELLSGNLPYPAMQSAIKQLKIDMQNRHDSYQEQINQLQGQISGAGKPQGAAGAPTQQGSGFSIKAPNGKTYSFKDQASLDAFKKSAGIP